MESVLLKKYPTTDLNPHTTTLNIPLLSQYVHNAFNLNPILSYSTSKIDPTPSHSSISWDLLFLHHRLKLTIHPTHTHLSIFYNTQWLPIETLPNALHQRHRLLSHLLPHHQHTTQQTLPHILDKLKTLLPPHTHTTLSHHLRILSSPFPISDTTPLLSQPHHA